MPSKKKSVKKAVKKQTKQQLTIAVLSRARDLIAKGGWIKGHLGADKNGMPTNYELWSACKFCAWGALLRAGYDLTGVEFPEASALATEQLEAELGTELVKWNDTRKSSKPVLALFDEAIARLEAKHA